MSAFIQDRVALVTGGSRGIGRATALRLAHEGAHVAISYVSRTVEANEVVAEIEALGGLAFVLHQAVTDPTRERIQVVYVGPKPDLLRDEAQAIMTGHLGEDGIFYADELLLKCPTKYEEAVPEQSES